MFPDDRQVEGFLWYIKLFTTPSHLVIHRGIHQLNRQCNDQYNCFLDYPFCVLQHPQDPQPKGMLNCQHRRVSPISHCPICLQLTPLSWEYLFPYNMETSEVEKQFLYEPEKKKSHVIRFLSEWLKKYLI